MKTAYHQHIPETLAEVCQPSHCALIIYDMQVGIVNQIDTGATIVSRCQELLQAARQAGYRIFFTRHVFLPTAAAGVGQLRRGMIWSRTTDPALIKPHFVQGSPAFEIVPELLPLPHEVVIDKITMSAFEATYLNLALRDAGMQAFIIAGIALEIGIEPTVRQGLDLNYLPVVVTDACGARTPENHAHALATLVETCEVFTARTEEVLPLLANKPASLT